MKSRITAVAIAICAPAFLAGCSTMGGGDSIAGVGAAVADAFTGPDTDYKNYLTYCKSEVKAQGDAAKADGDAIKTALTSPDEKVQLGGMLIMAFKAGAQPKRIGCSAERRQGFTELLLRNNNLLQVGVELYKENRANSRFARQLDADKENQAARFEHDENMTRQNNDLLTTLTGDKLTLQESAQDDAFRNAELDAETATTTAP